MSDLSETELLAATTVHDRLKAVNVRAWVDPVALIETDRLQRAALEIRRHRSALAADRERVRSVVECIAAHELGPNQPYTGWSDTAMRIATRAAEQLATARPAWAPNKEHVRTIVDNAVIDVASVVPPLRSTNLRMMSAAIADRVADALAPSPSKSEPVDEESDYEKRNRELHRLGRLAGKP